jgi:hypothetical protein
MFMERTIKIELNKYDAKPNLLAGSIQDNAGRFDVSVDLAALYHHYYLDAHGKQPPNPDPTQFEYAAFLSNCAEFRLAGDGIGNSVLARRHASASLGQAFCRWFMHKYLGITYFVHMQHVLNKARRNDLGGLQFSRSQTGDTPDYVCTGRSNDVVLAEAKGRYSSISFHNQEFTSWRKQFERLVVTDKNQILRTLKGYIVGTRFATEESGGRIASTLYAEDPDSPGESPPDGEQMNSLRSSIITGHYSNIATKLNQPLLASALGAQSELPEQLGILAMAWEFQEGPLNGQRFVGGYYPSNPLLPAFSISDSGITRHYGDPLRLDVGQGTFFGVAENVFRSIVSLVRRQSIGPIEVPTFEQIEPFYSAISVLRDGSLMAPLEFLQPVEPLRL